MATHFPTKETSSITVEACAWIAQLETGDLTDADREAFSEWIGRSPRHAAEIRKIAELSLDINILSGMAEPIRKAAQENRKTTNKAQRKPLRLLIQSTAFAALMAAIIATALLMLPLLRPVDEPMLASTLVGEQRDITLSDGTRVTLNTNTQIEVSYRRDERKVRLLQGEAFFKVAHKRHWPFIVYAGDNTFRAVGTAFAVSMFNGNTAVTVTEGRVKLAAAKALSNSVNSLKNEAPSNTPEQRVSSTSKAVVLDKGQSISVSSSKQLSAVISKSPRELERELAWRSGLVEFADTPLQEVIDQVNRYSTQTIEITDPALAQLKFGGLFRTGEIKPLLEALRVSYNVSIADLGDNRVGLSRETTESSPP